MSGFRRTTSQVITYPGPSFNVLPQNMPNWRKAVANVLGGTAPSSLLMDGDSTTNGTGPAAATIATAYPTVITGLINSRICPCAQTWTFPRVGFIADPRLVLNAPWVLNNAESGGEFSIWQTGTIGAAALAYTPCGAVNGPSSVDTVDVYYVSASNLGTFTVDIGGIPLATVNTAVGTSNAVNRVSVALGSAATPTINVKYAVGGAAILIVGIDAYLSTSPVIHAGNYGQSSSTAANWVSNFGGQNLGYLLKNWATNFTSAAVPLALTIGDLGINDLANTAATPAQVAAFMQTFITLGKQSGDVMLKSMSPTSAAAFPLVPALETQYVALLETLCLQNSVALVDIYDRFVSWTVANSFGFEAADGVHPSALGYADIAGAVETALALVV